MSEGLLNIEFRKGVQPYYAIYLRGSQFEDLEYVRYCGVTTSYFYRLGFTYPRHSSALSTELQGPRSGYDLGSKCLS